METHSIVDNTPAELCLEAWRRFAHRFDPTSAPASLNSMSKNTESVGKVDNISFCVEKWEEMVHRQDGRSVRQSLADGTTRAIMMHTPPVEVEKHLILKSVMFDMYPKVKSATRDCTEQMRHTLDPMGLDKMASSATWKQGGGWEENPCHVGSNSTSVS